MSQPTNPLQVVQLPQTQTGLTRPYLQTERQQQGKVNATS